MSRVKVSKKQALTACGTHLKKGYVYGKGGEVFKVTPKKAPAKKAAPKKKTTAKKGLKKPIRKHEGINQTTGRLKKGYKYGPNGTILKAKAKK